MLAMEHELGDCLRRKGWNYPDQDILYFSPSLQPGYTPMLAASTIGFGIFTSYTVSATDAPPRFELSLSAAEKLAFLSDLEGKSGCKEAVAKEWKQRNSLIVKISTSYYTEVLEKVLVSPEIRLLTAEWSTCMVRSTGRKFENPDAVVQLLLRKKAEIGKSQEWAVIEIDLAKNNLVYSEELQAEQNRQRQLMEPDFVRRHREDLLFIKDNIYGGVVPK